MSVERLTRTITIGYQLRCYRCGTASPLAQVEGDVYRLAEAAGWEVGESIARDWCPRCLARREEELDARFTLKEAPGERRQAGCAGGVLDRGEGGTP
jgi:hypothetical protein